MLNKLETLVKTWDTKTLVAGINRQHQAMADMKHEWMGSSRELAQYSKLEKRYNILVAEFKTR